MMNVLFHTNAGPARGLGHLRRCITLADALMASGIRCEFLFDGHGELDESLIPNRFGIRRPKSMRQSARSLPLPCITSPSVRRTPDARFDWLVVDDYEIGADWESQMRSAAHKVLVIDDLANREHDCEILLDQTMIRCAADYQGLVADSAELLIGSSFALLRPRFAELREEFLHQDCRRKSVRNIFVSLGGTDPNGLVEPVLRAIGRLPSSAEMTVRVAISNSSARIDALRDVVKGLNYKCLLYVDEPNIAELMVLSDLAVSAGGMTSYELACLGVPTLVIPASPIEANVAKALAAQADVVVMNRPLDDPEAEVFHRISDQKNCLETRATRNGPSRALDGRGTERVLDVMLAASAPTGFRR